MRHYYSRQRADGKWDYTCGDRPIGYCQGYHPYDEKMVNMLGQDEVDRLNAIMEQRKDLYHTCGHNTEQEACECYKQYMLDHHLHLNPKQKDPQQLVKCKVCGEFCSGHAMVGSYTIFRLCEKHCNLEEVSKLYSVGESWES